MIRKKKSKKPHGPEPERIEDLWGVLPRAGKPKIGKPVRKRDIELSEPMWAALREGGWILVRVEDDAVARLRKSGLPPDVREVVPAYWNPARPEEISFAFWRLTVILRGGGRPRAGLRTLRDLGLEPLRRYTWNPAACSVPIPPGRNDPYAYARTVKRKLGGRARVVTPELACATIPQQDYTPYEWQWQLHGNTDPRPNCRSNAHMRVESAWPITKGAGSRIAVIDRSFQWDHPNLIDAVLESSAYLPTSGGIHVGPAHLVPAPDDPDVLSYHGTGCAGLAAARPDPGGFDLSGVAPEAELVLIRITSMASAERMADAIMYAVHPNTLDPTGAHPEEGVDVISCSLGVPEFVPADEEDIDPILNAIHYAATAGRECRGCPVFWSAPNMVHPISDYRVQASPEVIAVGRTNCRDSHSDGCKCGYGDELDVVAPGCSVRSTKPWDTHADMSGTSFATPLAAGVAALMISGNPAITAKQIRDALRETADKVGTGANYHPPGPLGHDPYYGYGRVNAKNAVFRAMTMIP